MTEGKTAELRRKEGASLPLARILLVEDDASIALGLQLNLTREGYTVRMAHDGETGLAMARAERPDLIILDVMLPRLDGFSVVRKLREAGDSVRILLLSARSGEIDKVTGLELGAEDYVAKPFGLAELLARVRSTLRRGTVLQVPTLYTVGGISLDMRARTVQRRGEAVELTTTEFEVLRCLMQAQGEALSREEIMRRVWGPKHVGTPRTIDNFVQQLRTKLETDATAPQWIVTVRGVGYRLEE